VLYTIILADNNGVKNMSDEKKKLALVVKNGTLDSLYCAMILSSTATAMGWEAHLYFTFWGLNSLMKGAMEKLGLPATYKNLEEPLRTKLKEMKYPTPLQMLRNVKETGLGHFYACSPTMAMFNVKKEDLIPEVDEVLGAAGFLDLAANSDVTLFI
jgi:peroxiredoxin family protein